LVATPGEIRRYPAELVEDRTLFAIKEAVYKGLHPINGVFLDFQEIEIDLNAGIARTRNGNSVAVAFTASPRIIALAWLMRGRKASKRWTRGNSRVGGYAIMGTQAWTIGTGIASSPGPATLERSELPIAAPAADEVLVEPLFGCMEGNMLHAIRRHPIDVCVARQEERVVLGNAGVVRVVEVGNDVEGYTPGTIGLVCCVGSPDDGGFPHSIFGYDAPGSIGMFARLTKLKPWQILPLPAGTRHSLPQWAGFSLRYITAWANWLVASRCLAAFRTGIPAEKSHVWGWGGGVAFAELSLARLLGYPAAMIASSDTRLARIAEAGLMPVDRRAFADLSYDETLYRSDAAYRDRYLTAEGHFLATVHDRTDGRGVSIFIEMIGQPVTRATLKVLARPGIITTAGWLRGMSSHHLRAIECIAWHTHVHTHYSRYADAIDAVAFAERTGWMPPKPDRIWDWDDIPEMVAQFGAGTLDDYFPIFRVNCE
jgi:NADPH:quinone reductase-like Zn-dependent oxidoreductase